MHPFNLMNTTCLPFLSPILLFTVFLMTPLQAFEEEEEAWYRDFLQNEWPAAQSFYGERFPDVLSSYRETTQRNAEEGRQMQFALFELFEEYQKMAAEDIESAEVFIQSHYLEFQSRQIAANIRHLKTRGMQEEADREQAKLMGILNRIMDMRMELKRRELRNLEAELETLNRLLQRREALREEIIEARFLELVTGEDVLGW